MEFRKLTGLFAALLLIVSAGTALPSAAQEFEGVVRQRIITVFVDALADEGLDVSSALFEIPIEDILGLRGRLEADGSMTVEESEILIKGSWMRVDASDEEGPAYATVDLAEGVTRMVRPGEGMYIEMTGADLEQMSNFVDEYSSGPPEVTDTGRTSVINGKEAVAFEVFTDEGESLIWVWDGDPELTRSFGQLVEQMSSMSMDEAPDPQVMILEYGVPVLVQSLDYDMYTIEETLSIDRRAVPDDAFAIESGLERITMQDMMGGSMPSGGVAMDEQDAMLGLSGLAGMEAPPAWIEYEVAGAWQASAREDDVVMCSDTEDGFLARSLGDVIIDLDADEPGLGDRGMSVYVARASGGRFEGRGTLTIRDTGEEAFGFPIYEVEFEGSDLEADGAVVSVSGRLACSAM